MTTNDDFPREECIPNSILNDFPLCLSMNIVQALATIRDVGSHLRPADLTGDFFPGEAGLSHAGDDGGCPEMTMGLAIAPQAGFLGAGSMRCQGEDRIFRFAAGESTEHSCEVKHMWFPEVKQARWHGDSFPHHMESVSIDASVGIVIDGLDLDQGTWQSADLKVNFRCWPTDLRYKIDLIHRVKVHDQWMRNMSNLPVNAQKATARRLQLISAIENAKMFSEVDESDLLAEDLFPLDNRSFVDLLKRLELPTEVRLAALADWQGRTFFFDDDSSMENEMLTDAPARMFCTAHVETASPETCWKLPVREVPTLSFRAFSKELAEHCRDPVRLDYVEALVEYVRVLSCSLIGNDEAWDEFVRLAD